MVNEWYSPVTSVQLRENGQGPVFLTGRLCSGFFGSFTVTIQVFFSVRFFRPVRTFSRASGGAGEYSFMGGEPTAGPEDLVRIGNRDTLSSAFTELDLDFPCPYPVVDCLWCDSPKSSVSHG